MATSSWRVEDLAQLEEYGLAGQLESTSLEARGEGRGCDQGNGDQDWYCMSEVLSDLLTDVQHTPHLPFILPSPQGDSAHPQGGAAVEVTLNSPTAYGMKAGSETITYINKGQPYEILLKANLQDRVLPEDTLYKCVFSLGFSELRMRNSEQELFDRWGQEHPCERLLEIDKRGCDGLTNIQNGEALSAVSCVWQPVQRGILSLRINCLSSEFAAKKHGGEKGILLQLSADIFSVDAERREAHILRTACNVKVFKDKGGDRKQKMDQLKMEKLPPQELAKYLPSKEVTHFNPQPATTWTTALSPASSPAPRNGSTMSPQSRQPSIQHNSPLSPLVGRVPVDAAASQKSDLSTLASIEEAHSWLTSHNFTPYLSLFANYCGADLLRLSRRDLVELCGPADGIRLFNALRSRTLRTLYVCLENASVYQAVCLDQLTAQDLLAKLSEKVGLQANQVSSLLHLTSSGILVLVDDTVVENFQDEECFVVQPLKEESGLCRVILRSQGSPAGNGLSVRGNSPRTATT